MALLRRDRRHGAIAGRGPGIFVNPLFDRRTEIADQTLDGPCRRITQRTDSVAFDLLSHFEQHVDFALLAATLDHPLHDAHHPAGALAARRALAAALVLEERRDAP